MFKSRLPHCNLRIINREEKKNNWCRGKQNSDTILSVPYNFLIKCFFFEDN